MLRILLIGLAVSIMLLAPEPQVRTVLSWPMIVPTLIAPIVAPLVLMGLVLDTIMAKLMSADTGGAAARKRVHRIMLLNVLLIAGLVYTYVPFFLALGR